MLRSKSSGKWIMEFGSVEANTGPKPCVRQNPSHLSEVLRTQSPKCSRATALKWAMCARFLATKWCGMTRSHVPVVSFQTLSHVSVDSSASKRSLTSSLFSGVSQQGLRGRERTIIAGLRLVATLLLCFLPSFLGWVLTTPPVTRSLPLCALLWCFIIF